MGSYAWPPEPPSTSTPLLGRVEHPAPGAEPVRVRRIRYPEPNTLGLIKPTPYVETLLGRQVESY